MAAAVMKETRFIGNNPRKLTEESVSEKYEKTWHQPTFFVVSK